MIATGEDAKGPTAEEFKHVMIKVGKKIKGTVAKYPDLFRHRHPKVSFDNDAIHTLKVSELNVPNLERLHLPKNSPDFHQIIECVFGQLAAAFQKIVDKPCNQKRSMAYYKRVVRNIFFQNITAE